MLMPHQQAVVQPQQAGYAQQPYLQQAQPQQPQGQFQVQAQAQFQQHPMQQIQYHQQQQQQHQAQRQQLKVFWNQQMREVENSNDFKNHQLPLARIKKIMKSDEEVRMISAEAPVLFAKACEMFVLELTLRSWIHSEENKRRTLQRNDIAAAITKTDIFDFLVDIVPRDDIKEENVARPVAPGADGVQPQQAVPQMPQQAYQQPVPPALGVYYPQQQMPKPHEVPQHMMHPGQPGQHLMQGQPGMPMQHLMYAMPPQQQGMPQQMPNTLPPGM